MNIRFTDNEIDIDGESVTLPGPVEKIVEINELVVVLYRPSNGETSGRSIRAYDRFGTKQWSIEPATMPTGESYRYTGLRIEDGELWAYNWKGGDYRIDPSTGTCAAVDLEADRVSAEQTNANPDSSVFLVSEDEWDFEIRFDSDSDGQVPVPEIVIAGTSWFSDPWENGVGDDEYQRRVDRLFELICRLAMALEVEYAPMLGHVDPMQVWPTDRPLAENVEELPYLASTPRRERRRRHRRRSPRDRSVPR